MSDLEKLKKCLDEIGIFYKEKSEVGFEDNIYTYIVFCNEDDVGELIDQVNEKFIEFENGHLASY